jgi:hypothetical protein
MHTYRKLPNGWVVGFDPCTGDPRQFEVLCTFRTEAQAAAYVSYLNGGARNASNHFPPASD